jgi:hypothetical protein
MTYPSRVADLHSAESLRRIAVELRKIREAIEAMHPVPRCGKCSEYISDYEPQTINTYGQPVHRLACPRDRKV